MPSIAVCTLADTADRPQVKATLDTLNARLGNGTVRLGTAVTVGPAGSRAPWQGQAQWQSGAFTTRLEDLMRAE